MHQWQLGENGLQVFFLLITVDVTVGALTGTRHTLCPKTTAVSCNIKKTNKKLHNSDVSEN